MPLKFADKSAYLIKTQNNKLKTANIKQRILSDERKTVIIVSDAEDGLNSEVSNDEAEYETNQSIPSISKKEKEEVFITIDDDTDTSDIGATSPKQIDAIQYSDEDNEPSILINQLVRGSSKKKAPSEDEHTNFEEFIADELRLDIPKRKAAMEDDHDYSPKRKGKQRDSSLNSTPEPSSSRPKRVQNTPKKENGKAPVKNKTSLEANSFENISKRRFLKTGYVYDTVMSYHATPDPIEIHPEDPRRIYKIFAILERHGLLAECQRIKSRRATREEITDIHSITHYRKMRETTKFSKRTQYIDLEHIYDSVYLNNSSFESGLCAAGSLIALLEALVKDEIRNAFAIIRPPGHHAEHDVPMGFCLFNNVAIATRYCMKNLGVKRTLIVDWDVHFGNGTQSIFSDNPDVLYISLHRYEDKMFYPSDRKGSAEYTGHGKGRGTTVNIPWPCSGMADADYLYAFKEVVIPIAMEFNPDLLVVSAGFDAAMDDPIGQCKVTPSGYAHMTHMLQSVNNGKIAIALEGGYNLNSIALSALGCMNVLLGDAPPAIEKNLEPKKECIDTIKLVKSVQKDYWRCCR